MEILCVGRRDERRHERRRRDHLETRGRERMKVAVAGDQQRAGRGAFGQFEEGPILLIANRHAAGVRLDFLRNGALVSEEANRIDTGAFKQAPQHRTRKDVFQFRECGVAGQWDQPALQDGLDDSAGSAVG